MLFIVSFLTAFCAKGNFSKVDGLKYVPVVLSIDENYVRPTIVALISLFENRNLSTFYQVSILVGSNFSVQSRTEIGTLKGMYEKCQIGFIDVGIDEYGSPKRRWPVSTYYRLKVPTLFPHQKKCFYIDADVIIRHDLYEMFNVNMEKYYIAGMHDIEEFHIGECRKLKIPNVKQYVCGGVMVMNLENIRQDKLEMQFLKLFEEKRDVFERFFADQTIINMVCFGKILCFPPHLIICPLSPRRKEWEIFNDPLVVHFSGPEKPWKFPELTIFHKEFWEYAEKLKVYDEEIKRLKKELDVINEYGKIVSKRKYERQRLRENKGTEEKNRVF